MRPIDADALINNIESLSWLPVSKWVKEIYGLIANAPTIPLPDFKDGYKQAILDGKTNYQRPEGEWIPVSERLPEINVDVIVSDIETTGTYSGYYVGHGLWMCDNGTFNGRVVAWKPFPEPYKKGGAE